MDKTEEILINILKDIKNKFKETGCNRTAIGFLDSYNIVKKELELYNPIFNVNKISNKNEK